MTKIYISIVLAILILINGMGCYFYNTAKMEDVEKIDYIEKAEITTINEKTQILTDVTIEKLQVKGYVDLTHSEWLKSIEGEEIRIPIGEIQEIKVREYDSALSTAIVVTITVAPFLVLYALTQSMNYPGW